AAPGAPGPVPELPELPENPRAGTISGNSGNSGTGPGAVRLIALRLRARTPSTTRLPSSCRVKGTAVDGAGHPGRIATNVAILVAMLGRRKRPPGCGFAFHEGASRQRDHCFVAM